MRVDELAERKFENLVLRHMDRLSSVRSYVVPSSEIENVPEWRKAARAAGRRLEIRVRTGISRDGTLVWVTEEPEDFPYADSVV
jgi:hypothetical protein